MNKHIALSSLKVSSLNFREFGISEDDIRAHFSHMPNPYGDPEGAIAFARQPSTTTLLAPFLNYLETHQAYPAIKLSGIPIDDQLPETPGLDHATLEHTKKTFISEGLLLSASLKLGTPYSFKAEFNNQLIHQVRPIQEKKDSLTSLGSEQNLGFHQEVGFSELKPDFILLLGLRRGNQIQPTYTQLFFNKAIVERLEDQNPELLSTLQKPFFQIHPTPAFSSTTLSEHSYPLITKDSLGHYDIAYMANATIDTKTAQATDALHALEEICASGYSARVEIQEGDLLLINNKKTLHARTPFTPQFADTSSLRWLQRVYVRKTVSEALAHGYQSL